MKLTQQELDELPAKTKKHAEVVQLYLDHDFLTAYAMHTDWRVDRDGPQGAIGAVKDWERHGLLQLAFLQSQGLRPTHRLLEIGCGTGRLARKVVPYLEPGNYVGVDISAAALDAARRLSIIEGWARQVPRFQPEPPNLMERFEFAWAFSVFIHLPAELVRCTMAEVRNRLTVTGRFYFSYVPETFDGRTGLKQFRHRQETWEQCAADAGLMFYTVPWKGEQRIACAQRRH